MSVMQTLFGAFASPASPATTQTQQQTQQPEQQPTQPGNIPQGSGVASPGNTTVPADQLTQQSAQETPLAQFADLWQPTDNKGATPSELFASVDPKKLMEAAQRTDFSKSVPPAVMEAISKGGQEGVAASLQAMNSMAQTVYANSAMATTKIVEQALAKQMESFKASLPQIIKQHSLSDSLRSENPIFSNPAVQPLIAAMESQLAVKYPNATSSELTKMAKQYIEGLGSAFSPAAPQSKEEQAKAGEMDWSQFIN